eukprot:8854642-Heterocapsa_arctica.AAC.1
MKDRPPGSRFVSLRLGSLLRLFLPVECSSRPPGRFVPWDGFGLQGDLAARVSPGWSDCW